MVSGRLRAPLHYVSLPSQFGDAGREEEDPSAKGAGGDREKEIWQKSHTSSICTGNTML